jgi:glycosyltransferase involved in cell wall biosynthesis
MAVRVLHSFPHKIGAARICTTAWHEVADVAHAGADVTLYTGAVARPLPPSVRVRTTLARGRWRIPYSVLGQLRALELHDRIVAWQLPKLAPRIDLVHVWPLAARHTLQAAKRLGLPTVLERPNAHTRFAYEIVARECERLGVALPPGQEHAYNASKLRIEEEEYALTDHLLCPSDFVARTFVDQGVPAGKLLRHAYGFDDSRYYPADRNGTGGGNGKGLQALFVGVCAVRKGLHYALEAWLRSPVSKEGTFTIAGEFLPGYQDRLADMLAHPSVRVLGHRNDVPELMRRSDVLLLPSLEEGSPLVCLEAVASGCVPLVSDHCDEVCVDGNALVHRVGDVAALTRQLTDLNAHRNRLNQLRAACIRVAPRLTWASAGHRLLEAYEEAARVTPSAARAEVRGPRTR